MCSMRNVPKRIDRDVLFQRAIGQRRDSYAFIEKLLFRNASNSTTTNYIATRSSINAL